MLNFKKILVSFLLVLMLISSTVLATEEDVIPLSLADNDLSTSSTPAEVTQAPAPNTINADFHISNDDSYTFSDIVEGNAFVSVKSKFSTNPRNNGGIINGNLFLIAGEAVIGSDFTYSNNTNKYGNYVIDSINAKSVIKGNVYALAKSFTIEAGSEIYGDLYICADELTIDPNAVIHGNIYAYATTIDFNGQVQNSAYITSNKINMSYYSYVGRDLFLDANTATLDGTIYRNASISTTNSLVTKANFKVNQDLQVNYAETATLSGKITGNATIVAKNLSFKNDAEETLVIRGNLNYATKSELNIPDEVVLGTATSSEFVDNSSKTIKLTAWTFSFIALLFFVYTVIFLFRKLAPKALESLPTLGVVNIFKGLLAGFLSIFAVVALVLLLFVLGIGIKVGIALILAYVLVLLLSTPLFLNKIALVLKFKLNHYVKLLIVTMIFFLITLIPYVGSIISFLVSLIGTGDVILAIFKNGKNK